MPMLLRKSIFRYRGTLRTRFPNFLETTYFDLIRLYHLIIIRTNKYVLYKFYYSQNLTLINMKAFIIRIFRVYNLLIRDRFIDFCVYNLKMTEIIHCRMFIIYIIYLNNIYISIIIPIKYILINFLCIGNFKK